MPEAGKADDRLPWLDAPRTPPRRPPAARRAQGPLLAVLGLFGASMIAVMAFLAGRGSAPSAIEEMASRPAATSITLPPPAPPPAVIARAAPPEVDPAPLAVDAAPLAVDTAGSKPAAPAPARPPRVERAPARAVSDRPAVTRSAAVKPSRAPVRPPRYRWPAPAADAPSGRVIQLGAYYSGAQTMASWRRLRRAYPYLAQLPRRVTVIPAEGTRPRYYRLRIGAASPQQARALCDQLHRIGRGCIVV